MPFYSSDDPNSIRQVFSNDSESLTKAGFTLPGELKIHADDTLPKTAEHTQQSLAGMSKATIDAYNAWQLTGSEESF